MSYLIGLDIGTSSVKGILMTEDGKIINSAKGSFKYHTIPDKIIDINADKFTEVCINVIKELADYGKGDITAVCASAASGNLLILDRDMKPSTPIINWQDTRVSSEAKELFPELDTDSFYRQTGWRFGYNTFPLAQVCYIKKNNPEILKNAGKICMSTEYLYYLLTGKWGITTSAATPFYFVDQKKGEYIPFLLKALELSKDMFPPVMPEATVLGGILPHMANITGLKSGTPVVLGTFDHPSAARGVGVLNEGEVLLSCGTSWVTFFPIRDREKIADTNMLIDPFMSGKGGCWAGMTSVASISERIWFYVSKFIDNTENAFSILSTLAKQSEPGANGLEINIKEEPDCATIFKYPLHHIARAIMEGTVNLLKQNLDGLVKKGITATEGIMVGGPSEDPYWIELIEQMCSIRLKVIHGKFAGAVGAAVMAGMAVGIYKDEFDFKTRLDGSYV